MRGCRQRRVPLTRVRRLLEAHAGALYGEKAVVARRAERTQAAAGRGIAMEGALASNVLSWLLRVGLQASVLVILVLLAQKLLRNRVSPAWRHALWLLVAAR